MSVLTETIVVVEDGGVYERVKHVVIENHSTEDVLPDLSFKVNENANVSAEIGNVLEARAKAFELGGKCFGVGHGRGRR